MKPLRALTLAVLLGGTVSLRPTLGGRRLRGRALAAEVRSTTTMRMLGVGGPPALDACAPRRVGLMVEPTPFTHVSGYSNRFKEMLKYLKRAGDEVAIVTPDDTSEAPAEHQGYRITTINGFRFPLYHHICLSFDLGQAGLKAFQNFKPDLLHVTSPGFLAIISIAYARTLKCPLVMSYHTHLPVYAKNYMGWVPGVEELAWKTLRAVHNRADLNLVTSPQIKEELEANGIERVAVWRKGIDSERFNPSFRSEAMREKLGATKDGPLLVYVGRLGAEKRIKDLKGVLERVPNARLAIVGGGPFEAELKAHFAGTNTVFTGQVSGDELSESFASADVFCMPSDSETLGFVVLEAMASGVPVVGANAGGIPSLINDKVTSFLVEPGDVEAMADLCTRLFEDKALDARIRKAAREEAERWDWEAATSVLRNVQYKRAMINYQWRSFASYRPPAAKRAGGFVLRLLRWAARGVAAPFRARPV